MYSDLVGDDSVSVRQSLRDEVVVSYLQERAHRSGLVRLARGPGAHARERHQQRIVRPNEEPRSALRRPIRKLVGHRRKFVANFFDA